MSQINVPTWCYTQDPPGAPTKAFSTLVLYLEFIQQNVVVEQPNQPANMQAPLNGMLQPNATSVTPDQPLGEILVYLEGCHFRPEQATSATLYVAPIGGAYSPFTLPPNPGQITYRLTATKAMFPSTGQFKVYVELDFQGDRYISNYGVVNVNQVPLQ